MVMRKVPRNSKRSLSPDFELDIDGPNPCHRCAELCTTFCGGCVGTPSLDGYYEPNTFYCSKACQTQDWPTHKSQCKNFQDRKYLHRATGMLHQFWLLLRAHLYDVDVQAVDYDHQRNVLKIKCGWHRHPENCAVLPMLHHFPGKLLEGRFEQRFLSTMLCTGVQNLAYSYLLRPLLCALSGRIKAVTIATVTIKNMEFAMEWQFPYRLYRHDGGQHQIFQVTLNSGERWALNILGPAFGWDALIYPWGDCFTVWYVDGDDVQYRSVANYSFWTAITSDALCWVYVLPTIEHSNTITQFNYLLSVYTVDTVAIENKPRSIEMMKRLRKSNKMWGTAEDIEYCLSVVKRVASLHMTMIGMPQMQNARSRLAIMLDQLIVKCIGKPVAWHTDSTTRLCRMSKLLSGMHDRPPETFKFHDFHHDVYEQMFNCALLESMEWMVKIGALAEEDLERWQRMILIESSVDHELVGSGRCRLCRRLRREKLQAAPMLTALQSGGITGRYRRVVNLLALMKED